MLSVKKVIRALSSLFLSGEARSKPLEVGADAPKISVINQDGLEIHLDEQFSRGLTLVYFYPKADTPGCTKQACNLRDAFVKVEEAGIEVIGVSADKPEEQKAFASVHHLPFTLIADTDLKMIKAFGVPLMIGRFAARQSFLIKEGRVIWVDLKAIPKTQAEDAINAAKENQ